MRQFAVFAMQDSGFNMHALPRWLAEQMEKQFPDREKMQSEVIDGQGYSAVRFSFPREKTLTEAYIFRLSYLLSEWFINEGQGKVIRYWIKKECGKITIEHLNDIEAFCQKLWKEKDGQDSSRLRKKLTLKETLARQFQDYIRNHVLLVIDGFIRFRMKRFMENLRRAVENAIEEYMVEQQYQEFILMLRLFVGAQESKIPEAHIFHQGQQRFELLDAQMRPLPSGDGAHFETEAGEKTNSVGADMIVSRLIAILPEKIFIHTDQPEEKVIQTIRQIFSDRTELCTVAGQVPSFTCDT